LDETKKMMKEKTKMKVKKKECWRGLKENEKER